ncbi:HEAT repeat domain-containing protein [Nonomuraea sp. NPDC049709]|uniref:HEAT repeat domain-containing protein n=1 Tax=Nonomuraea sp. NPDC049709 TaxID=3154736 RepID=UPI0034321EAF
MDPERSDALIKAWGDWDEPGEPSGRGMRKLLSELGIPVEPDPRWGGMVWAASGRGAGALLPRLAHRDPEVRRMAAHVLGWTWDEARTILPALRDRLPAEADRPARVAVVLAVAQLAARTWGPDRAAAERWLTGLLAWEPELRYAAALGLCGHVLPLDEPVPGEVMAALAGSWRTGGRAWVELYGHDASDPVHAAIEGLDGRPIAQLDFTLSVLGTPEGIRPGLRAADRLLRFGPCLDGTRPDQDEKIMELLRALARLAAGRDGEIRTREGAARVLSGLDQRKVCPVADLLAPVLDEDDVPDVREEVVRALCRAGDARALPALQAMIAGTIPRDFHRMLAGMRPWAGELVPFLARRLAAVPPITVTSLAEGRHQLSGGLDHGEVAIVSALAAWGRPAAPLAPALRRVRRLYEAGGCSGDDHPCAALRFALRRIGFWNALIARKPAQ